MALNSNINKQHNQATTSSAMGAAAAILLVKMGPSFGLFEPLPEEAVIVGALTVLFTYAARFLPRAS